MSTDPSENYFLLLDLDPDAPWDQGAFEDALARKHREWSRLSSISPDPKKKTAAMRHMRMLAEIKRDLEDPVKRNELAKEARAVRSADSGAKLKEFESELQLRSAKKYLLEEEVAELIMRFAESLSEAEIRKRIKVMIRAPGADSRASTGAQPLDPTQAKGMRKWLGIVDQPSLYAFLGQSSNAALEVLQLAAKSIYDATQGRAVKDEKLSARAELSGFCMLVFKTEEMRARYDATLRETVFDEILKRLDGLGSGTNKIYAPQIQMLLDQAIVSKLDPNEVMERIQQRAKTRGWLVEVPVMADVTARQRCGSCEELNPPEAKHCEACGEPLQYACPGCWKSVHSSSGACTACGFPIGNRYGVRTWLAESRSLADAGNDVAAAEVARRAAAAWQAKSADALAGEIQQWLDHLERRHKERAREEDDLRGLVRARKLYTAREQLRTASGAASGSLLIALRNEVEAGIRSAEQQLADISRRGLSAEESARALQQVLRDCKDCTAARELLATTPPRAPAQLSVAVKGGIVRLSWQAIPDDVAYVVVRKQGVRPSSVQDGKEVGSVAGHMLDDAEPPVGVPLYYAVFSDREGVPSRDGAWAQQAVLVVRPVDGITAEVNEGQVHLRWNPPPNARRVVVIRSQTAQPARTAEDGVVLEAHDLRQVVDRGLRNGYTYHYAVFAEFAGEAGQPVSAPGVFISATPQVAPEPIAQLDITSVAAASGRVVTISWTAPPSGQVFLLRSDRPVDDAEPIVPVAQLRTLGQTLAGGSESVTDHWSGLGVCYYTAVVVLGDAGYLGRSHMYVCVDDVDKLSAQNLGSVIRVQWSWPRDCARARLTYAYSGWPDLNNHQAPAVNRIEVSRAEYNRNGYYDLRQAAKQDVYIVVQAVIRQNSEEMLSSGTAAGARTQLRVLTRCTLTYELKKSMFGGKWQLRLKSDRPAELPGLVLIRKRQALPMNRGDGECVVRIPAEHIDKERGIALDGSRGQASGYVKLFLEEDAGYDGVNVLHPNLERLRLS